MGRRRLVVVALLTPLLLCSCAQPAPGQGNVVTYDCADGQQMQVRYGPGPQAVLSMDGASLRLPQLRSASGIRYGNGKTTLYGKGGDAFVERDGRHIADRCHAKNWPQD